MMVQILALQLDGVAWHVGLVASVHKYTFTFTPSGGFGGLGCEWSNPPITSEAATSSLLAHPGLDSC